MNITIQNYKQLRNSFDTSKLDNNILSVFKEVDNDWDDYLELYTDASPENKGIRDVVDTHLKLVNKYLVDEPSSKTKPKLSYQKELDRQIKTGESSGKDGVSLYAMSKNIKTKKSINLNKLQKLCDIVNNRNSKGLNDDDQVARMYKFEKSISDARVIIGWDDYQAMSIEDLKKEFKKSKKISDKEFFIGQYKCILPIEKYPETKQAIKKESFKKGDIVQVINLPKTVKGKKNPYYNLYGEVKNYQSKDVRILLSNGSEAGFLEENVKKTNYKIVPKPVNEIYNYKGQKVSIEPKGKSFIVWDIKSDQKFSNEKFNTEQMANKFVADNKMILVKKTTSKKKVTKAASKNNNWFYLKDDYSNIEEFKSHMSKTVLKQFETFEDEIEGIEENSLKEWQIKLAKNNIYFEYKIETFGVEIALFNVKVIKTKSKKTVTKAASKKESPCDEVIEDFLEQQQQTRDKNKAKRKRKKVANSLDPETINFYNEEFRLLRRFYNVVTKKTKVSFRRIQLLYMAFQKSTVARKVRKTSSLAGLFSICNKKIVKLYAAVSEEKSDANVTKIDEDLLEQLKKLVSNKKVDYTITLLNRVINMQGTTPEEARVERLLSSIKNAKEKGRIDERSRLFDDLKRAEKDLKDYLNDKLDKIPAKTYGLSGQKKNASVIRISVPDQVPVIKIIDLPVNDAIQLHEEKKLSAAPSNNIPAIEKKEVFNKVVSFEKKPVKTSGVKKENKLGFKKANEAPDKPEGLIYLPGQIGAFLQTIQSYQELILIKGNKHSSKSQLAMQIANGFGELDKEVAFIDYEQGGMQSKDTIDSIERNTSELGRSNIYIIGDLEKPLEEIEKICKKIDVIVADSVTDLNISADELSYLRKKYPKTIWIFISQVKENGQMYGGNKMAHNATKIIECHSYKDFRKRFATLEKSRGNDLDVHYNIFEKKAYKEDEEDSYVPQVISLSVPA